MKANTNMRKLISMLLCIVMVVGLLPIIASAAALPFTDVKTSAWYYNDVKIAYEGNLINGKSATTFDPDANLTYAEAVKLAACMFQKSMTGNVTLTNGNPWYQSYVDYCKTNGIISKDYSWNAKATRAGYMEIFAHALPEYSLKEINTIADGSIPDVPMSHPQAAAIYKLYRAGILQGSDAKHSCNPSASIKRSEVAAILTRMMNADQRLSFTMGEAEPLKITVQPQNTTASNGDQVDLTVAVSGGKAPYTYTWQSYSQGRWENLTTTSDCWPDGDTLYLRAGKNDWTTHEDIRCVIKDAAGNTVTSSSVRISIAESLKIITQPKSVTVSNGAQVDLTVAVSGGKAPYTYIWQSYSQGIVWEDLSTSADCWPDGDTLTLRVAKNDWTTNEDIRCIIKDSSGATVTSSSVRVSIADALKITAQPKSVTVSDGEQVDLTVAVSGGKAPYTYTWQSYSQGEWQDLSKSYDCLPNDELLTLWVAKNDWTTNEDIRCVIKDSAGNTVISSAVRVSVN